MVDILLNEAQAKLIRESRDDVCLTTPDGQFIAFVHRGSVLRTPDDEEAFFQRMKDRARTDVRTAHDTSNALEQLHRFHPIGAS